MMNQALDFLNGFSGGAYPARLEAEYDLLECFASTERGETLLARRRDDGAMCVVKIGDEGAFAPETLRELDCPGVPKIYDAYEDDGRSVLIRAFVPGVSARAALKNGPFSRKRTIETGVQLCDILACLHAQDPPIIHRDVKPGNIILDGERAWLIDFGIARSYTEDAEQDTACLGTRAYAPPEQYGYAQTDPRADVYALGATLYTMLTNRTDVINAKKTVSDRALARIILRATAFSPDDRYKSVSELRRALLGAKHRTRRLLTAAAMAAGCFAALLIGLHSSEVPLRDLVPGAARFSDPLVRAAVCASLGRAEDAFLTKTDLLNVTELNLCRDTAYADQTAFEAGIAASGGGAGKLGSLTTLADLSGMKNLTALRLYAEPDVDLSPLADCTRLEVLSLEYMSVSDLSVISGLPALRELNLAGSVADDLSPIHDCHSLVRLALHAVPCTDYSFLIGLDDFEYVGLVGADSTLFLQYFRGKQTNHLNIGSAPFSCMDWLTQVRGLTVLELQDAELTDITGIDALLHLMRIDLSGNPELSDLSPLLNIPTLEQVILSRDMQKAADRITGQAAFEIVYSD